MKKTPTAKRGIILQELDRETLKSFMTEFKAAFFHYPNPDSVNLFQIAVCKGLSEPKRETAKNRHDRALLPLASRIGTMKDHTKRELARRITDHFAEKTKAKADKPEGKELSSHYKKLMGHKPYFQEISDPSGYADYILEILEAITEVAGDVKSCRVGNIKTDAALEFVKELVFCWEAMTETKPAYYPDCPLESLASIGLNAIGYPSKSPGRLIRKAIKENDGKTLHFVDCPAVKQTRAKRAVQRQKHQR